MFFPTKCYSNLLQLSFSALNVSTPFLSVQPQVSRSWQLSHPIEKFGGCLDFLTFISQLLYMPQKDLIHHIDNYTLC